MATLSDIPDGVLAHVFALLAPSARPAVRLVCKHWCQLARRIPNFWDNLKIALCSTTSPSAMGVLCRLLATQKDMLRRLEVAAAGAGAPLRVALSSAVGGSLQHLWIKANTLTRAQLEASVHCSYLAEVAGSANRVYKSHGSG